MKLTKILATLPVLALALAACSSSPAATAAPATAAAARSAPTAAPTAALIYKADLKSANQNPPIQGAEATCSGIGTLTVTGVQAKFDVVFAGCPAGAAINIGHIHEGIVGVNGPVKVDSTLKAGELTLANGGATLSRTGPIDAAQATLIAANPAGFYMNFHSTLAPGGVVRGQLTKG